MAPPRPPAPRRRGQVRADGDLPVPGSGGAGGGGSAAPRAGPGERRRVRASRGRACPGLGPRVGAPRLPAACRQRRSNGSRRPAIRSRLEAPLPSLPPAKGRAPGAHGSRPGPLVQVEERGPAVGGTRAHPRVGRPWGHRRNGVGALGLTSRLRPPGPARGAGLDASTLVAGSGRAGRERGCGRGSRSSVASVPFAAPRVEARGRLGGPGAHRAGGASPGLLRHPWSGLGDVT